MKLYSPSEINEIRTIFGFRNSKSLGQGILDETGFLSETGSSKAPGWVPMIWL